MERIAFASDLDNTLLFSRKHALDTDLCVELLDGAPQGYLTRETPRYLARIMAGGLFIPVTSRSVEQYRRIQFPAVCRPRYAVTTNGAVLLADGEPDRQWLLESEEAVRPWRTALEETLAALEAQPLARRCRIVDGMFTFAACDTPEDARNLRGLLLDAAPLAGEVSGRKLYFFPPPVSKGAAITRLRARFGLEWVICAGDSSIDLPMLRQADVALVPRRDLMGDRPCRETVVCGPSERFYDFVLREAAARMAP